MKDFQIINIPFSDQTHLENQLKIKQLIKDLGGPEGFAPTPYDSTTISYWRLYIKNGKYDGWDHMEYNTYESLQPQITFSDYIEHNYEEYTPPPPPTTIEEVFKF